ncbi:MAG: pitrilysin family protein, partial [Pyrinomonadaceae bacterium]
MTEEFRKTAPEPLENISFDINKPFETKLSNGLKILIFENNRLPLVNFRLAFFSGDANEPKDSIGITTAFTSMLNEGTENYSSKQLAEEIERLGISIAASSSSDFTIVSASGLSFYTSDIFRLLSEIVLLPTFPESELKLYKQNTVESLKFQRSQPDFLANEQMARILYGEHPYSIISPKQSDVEKISRDQLKEFHRQKFIPNNATLIIVGDVNIDEITSEIETHFGSWEAGTVKSFEVAELPERTSKTLTIVDRVGSAQSNIVLGNIAIERTNPDYFPFLLMNQILGAGASSRVFMNLREEKGYTYGAYTRVDTKKLSGEFEATAEVRTSVTGDSLNEFFYELNRIRDEETDEEELQDAKNFLAGVFPIRAETQEGLTGLLVSQKLHDLPEDYLQTYRENINSVTVADVMRVAKKYVQPDKIAIVIVGDGEEILPQVKDFASQIEIFDTEGNKKNMEENISEKTPETTIVSGQWNLSLNFQGQEFPVSLVLEQFGENVSGKMDSMLGSGEISDGKVSGNKISAIAKTDFQGQTLELNLNGKVDGDSMSGTVNTPMIPMPIEFSGNRDR